MRTMDPQLCLWEHELDSDSHLNSGNWTLWGFNVTQICVSFVYRSCCSVGEAMHRHWPCWWFVPAGLDSWVSAESSWRDSDIRFMPVIRVVSGQVWPVSTELLIAGWYQPERRNTSDSNPLIIFIWKSRSSSKQVIASLQFCKDKKTRCIINKSIDIMKTANHHIYEKTVSWNKG